jgi:hypothetical protein
MKADEILWTKKMRDALLTEERTGSKNSTDPEE